MAVRTHHYRHCIDTLTLSLEFLRNNPPETAQYEVFRNAVIKGFELVLEMTGTLLRKSLKAYGGSPSSIDALSFKDVLRNASKRGLISADAVDRWFVYRNSRNTVAHDYGQKFADQALTLLPGFIADAKEVAEAIHKSVGQGDHD